jgi:hypothetical protein
LVFPLPQHTEPGPGREFPAAHQYRKPDRNSNNYANSTIQAIANVASIHFAFIEQGGSSLYPILALKAKDREVLRVLLSIGGVEMDHFSLWHDKVENAISPPVPPLSDYGALYYPTATTRPVSTTRTS